MVVAVSVNKSEVVFPTKRVVSRAMLPIYRIAAAPNLRHLHEAVSARSVFSVHTVFISVSGRPVRQYRPLLPIE